MAWKSKTTRGKNGVRITRTQRSKGSTRITTSVGNKAVRNTSTIDGNKKISKIYTNVNGWRTVKTKTTNLGAQKSQSSPPRSKKIKRKTKKMTKFEKNFFKWSFYIFSIYVVIAAIIGG